MPFSKCDLPQGTVEYFEKGIKNGIINYLQKCDLP